MERRIGPLRAEVIDPESAKFTAPLLLLHGLWSTPTIWRPFTGYLAHRGWLSIAPELTLAIRKTSPEAIEDALVEVIAALPAPPVIVGHDLGAIHALRLVEKAVAVVALAPLVLPPYGTPSQALRKAGSWIERVRRRALLIGAPRGNWQSSYPSHENPVQESKNLIQTLCEGSWQIPGRGPVPALMMVGGRDPITPLEGARALAEAVGAELRVEADAGHSLHVDTGWDQRVSRIHRWIVHALGPSLLAMLDESVEE